MLLKFNLDSQEIRANKIFVTFLYKIINNKIDCPHLLSKINFKVPRINARHTECIFYPKCRTNLGKKAPIAVMANYYNNICQSCDINFDQLKHILNVIDNSYLV